MSAWRGPIGDGVAKGDSTVDDPIGDELQARIDATEQLLKAHKFEHTQAMVAAQQAGSEERPPSTARLQTIAKLENQITNLRAFERVRNLTRETA